MMCKGECIKSTLCPVSLGIAIGFVKGLCMILFAWAGWLFGYGYLIVLEISHIYHGYAPTFLGGLWGGLWGLLGGFIFGFVTACIYNFCVRCCAKRS